MLLCFTVHLFDLFCVNTCGLFYHYMKSVFHCGDSEGRVIIVRYAYMNCVAESRLHQRLGRVKKAYFIRVGVILFCFGKFGFVYIGDSRKLDLRTLSVKNTAGVGRAHIAYSDYSESDFFTHFDILLYSRPKECR